jgi:hypothetical protein
MPLEPIIEKFSVVIDKHWSQIYIQIGHDK